MNTWNSHSLRVLLRKASCNQKGFSLPGALAAIVLLTVITFGMARTVADWSAMPRIRQTASDLDNVAMAAARYVKDRYADLSATLPLDGAATSVSFSELRDTGYISPSFSEVNPYGQTYSLRVRYITQGTGPNTRHVIEPLVVTEGGRAIPDRELLRIAEQLNIGGSIRSDSPTEAIGNVGSWQVPMAAFGGTPGAGHLAAGLFYSDAGILVDYLYRNAVPGRPEVNRMNAAIDMAANDLRNAGTTETDRLRVTAANGQAIWIDNDNGRLRWLDSTGTTETASLDQSGNLTVAGRVSAGEYMQIDGTATEGTVCSPDGLIGRTPTGLLLSCQSGVWRKQDFCTQYAGDLNTLDSSGCYNGANLGNAPTGDWLFVEVMRHYNTGNFYTVQRATGMTGGAAGKVWLRSQQSNNQGVGWGPWSLITGSFGFSELISGECTPPIRQGLTCYLADPSWFCTLSGVGGAGEVEFGYVERRSEGWYAFTQRENWPARYRWTCFR